MAAGHDGSGLPLRSEAEMLPKTSFCDLTGGERALVIESCSFVWPL